MTDKIGKPLISVELALFGAWVLSWGIAAVFISNAFVVWCAFTMVLTMIIMGMMLQFRNRSLHVMNTVFAGMGLLCIPIFITMTGQLDSPWFLLYILDAVFFSLLGSVLWTGLGIGVMIAGYLWAMGGVPFVKSWPDITFLTVFFFFFSVIGAGMRANANALQGSMIQELELSQLKSLQHSLADYSRFDESLTVILETGLRIVKSEAGFIAQLTPENHLKIIHASGLKIIHPEWAITSFCKTVVELGEMQFITDLTAESEWLAYHAVMDVDDVKGHQVALVPLRERELTWGVIGFFRQQDHPSLRDEANSLEILADILMTQIRLQTMQQSSEHRRALLKTLDNIGREVNRTLDMQSLLQSLFNLVAKVIPIDVFFVALLSQKPGHITMEFLYDEQTIFERSIMVLPTEGPTAQVIARKKGQIFHELSEQNRIEGTHRDPRCVIVVPLIYDEEVVGAISVQSYQMRFDEEHLEFLSSVASQASGAIRNAKLYQMTQQRALTDFLTGLGNSRHFDRKLEEAILQRERGEVESPLSLLLIDSDSLKKINDHYGHDAGDRHLMLLATAIQRSVRDTDVGCRYAGDEFVVILSDSTISEALVIGERIRRAMENTDFIEPELTVTVSIGAAQWKVGMTSDQLFKKADRAMYEAKTNGKNQVISIG